MPFFIATLLFLAQIVSGVIVPFDDWQHQRVALKEVSIHFRYHGTGPPFLLVHGYPQHSLTWHTIGPILAEHFTVIAPDNRGMGDSSIPANNDYTAETAAGDLKGILDFLQINKTHIFGHDKGSGLVTAFAAKYRSTAALVSVSEYGLPGFGYEQSSAPMPSWDLYANWQLAFFSVPDAAQYFIQGREREMLAWYFFHSSYSGTASVSADHLTRYATEISKPGFLRSGLTYFENKIVERDARFFNQTVKVNPIESEMLVLGGEASFGTVALEKLAWGGVGRNVSYDVVPKAGHWIADENPVWVANRLLRFFGGDRQGIPIVDLSYLMDKVTLT